MICCGQGGEVGVTELDGGDMMTSLQELLGHRLEGEDMAASVQGVEEQNIETVTTLGSILSSVFNDKVYALVQDGPIVMEFADKDIIWS